MGVQEQDFVLPWKSSDICPCGSSKRYGDCCARHGKTPLIKVPELLPPGPKSGLSNPNCYLNFTNDCCETKSREHYISKVILEQMPGSVVTLPWFDEPKSLPPNALTTNVLCKRHNSALSPLDTEAGRFFQALRRLQEPSQAGASAVVEWHLCSGRMIELWVYKVLAAAFHGGVLHGGDGKPMRETSTLNTALFVDQLEGKPPPKGAGLYIGPHFEPTAIGLHPFGAKGNPATAGLGINILGLPLMGALDPDDDLAAVMSEYNQFKPALVTVDRAGAKGAIFLTWDDQYEGGPIASLVFNGPVPPTFRRRKSPATQGSAALGEQLHHLRKHLRKLRGQLSAALAKCDVYRPQGIRRIAQLIYEICGQDDRGSLSALAKLGRGTIDFVSSVNTDRANAAFTLSLVNVALRGKNVGEDVRYVPLHSQGPTVHFLAIPDWWREPIYVSPKGQTVSRGDLIHALRREGGARRLEEETKGALGDLARIGDPTVRHSKGVMMRGPPDVAAPPGSMPLVGGHIAQLLQIAWEVELSIARSGG